MVDPHLLPDLITIVNIFHMVVPRRMCHVSMHYKNNLPTQAGQGRLPFLAGYLSPNIYICYNTVQLG